MQSTKRCIECGDSIIGRSDKKYCSDLCRVSYNNKLNCVSNSHVRNINTVLKRNRKILEELVSEKAKKIHKETLIQKGFNFSFYTNVVNTKKGYNQYYCYDYGYKPVENDCFIVIQKN
jgi:hypothetical protein